MAVLQGYARDGEYEKICQYLSEIDGDFYKYENKVWTGHKILDFILNQKKEAAEQKEIDFEICVTALMETSLSDGDISILIGNLLDNAIEACEQIRDGKRWILFKLNKRQRSLFIEISNSLGTVPRIKAVSYTHLDVYKRQSYIRYSNFLSLFPPTPNSVRSSRFM